MSKRKHFKNTVIAAVVISLVLLPACSPGSPAPTRTPETSVSPSVLSPSPTAADTAGTMPEELFAYDPSRPFNEKEISVEETENGVRIREMSYDAYDKTINSSGTIKFYLVEPKGEGPFPFVLYLHWISNRTGTNKEFLDEAVSMAEKGVGGLLPEGFFPYKKFPNGNLERDVSMIKYQVTELRRAVDYIQKLPTADAKRIGYVGHEHGAMYGAILSGVDKRINSYVLIAGMGDFQSWFFQYWINLLEDKKQAYIDALSILDPINYVGKAAPAALFFQFAKNDSFILKDTADAFYAAGSEPKEVKFYDTDHSMVNEEAQSDRDDWLLERLK